MSVISFTSIDAAQPVPSVGRALLIRLLSIGTPSKWSEAASAENIVEPALEVFTREQEWIHV
jgi:hypothetical protein